MTAEELEKYGDILFSRIDGFQDEVLKTIGRRIKQIGSLSAYDSQALKNLADITGDMKAITSQLAKVTGMNISDIEKVYTEALTDTAEKYKPLYDFRSMEFVPFAESEFGKNLIKHWAYETAGNMLNLSRTKAIGFTDEKGKFQSLAGAYQSAIDKAVFNMSTGTQDFNSAMRSTVEALGGSGIQVNYGSGVTRSLDSVIRSNLLYGAKKAAQSYDEHIGEELSCDGFEVDAHRNPRPSHEFMQGKMYSYDGEKTIDGVTYEDGAAALAALNDYGCLHFKTDVILGVSQPRYDKEYLDKLHKENTELIEYGGEKRTGYEWKQRQRALERAIRSEKGKLTIAEASGDKILAKKSKERIAAFKAKYDDVSDKVGLQKTPERMAASYKKTVANPAKSGIINTGRDNMGLSIEIDNFTPCLVNIKTGKIVNTKYSVAQASELKNLKKAGWNFNWSAKDLANTDIYKLTLENDGNIQGLIAVTDFPKDKALYINLAESAPHNIGRTKQYEGVGGHLFAIAAKESLDKGYGGFLFLDAKNIDLVQYYQNKFGATLLGMPHPYRMYIDEINANKLLEIYTLKGE